MTLSELNVKDLINRIWDLCVFITIALYLGLTVKRARNYVSLLGIIILILLGTIGIAMFSVPRMLIMMFFLFN